VQSIAFIWPTLRSRYSGSSRDLKWRNLMETFRALTGGVPAFIRLD
jgi:hypothetical protein